MKIKEIYVELAIKKSQDYQSSSNAVGLRGELEVDDDPIKMVKKLQEQCFTLLLKKPFAAGSRSAPAKAVPAQ